MARKHGMFRSALAGFGQGVRFGRKAFPIVKAGLGMVNRFRNSSSSRSAKSRRVTGQTTFQEDYRTLYKRRRAPRRVRRRARRGFQRFTYYLDKTQGMTSSIINNFYSASTTPTSPLTGSQGVHGIGMYGCAATTDASDFNSDLWKIYLDATGSAPTSTLAAATIRFRSCVMDFVVKNTHETNAMFLEVYQCVARRNGGNPDASQEWNEMIAKQSTQLVTTPITGVSAYKVTPFDAPGFGSYWYVKTRKRFYISVGNSVSWQVRDPKNYVITGEEIQKGDTLRNITECCIIVGYGADVNPWTGTDTSIGIPSACSYDVNCMKTYHFTVTENNNDNVGYANFS